MADNAAKTLRDLPSTSWGKAEEMRQLMERKMADLYQNYMFPPPPGSAAERHVNQAQKEYQERYAKAVEAERDRIVKRLEDEKRIQEPKPRPSKASLAMARAIGRTRALPDPQTPNQVFWERLP